MRLLAPMLAGSIVLLAALAAMPLLRRRSAALRHWMIAVALLCLALSPVLAVVAPAWEWTVVPAPLATVPQAPAALAGAVASTSDTRINPRVSQGTVDADTPVAPWVAVWAAFRALWIGGAVFALACVAVGFAQLARVTSRARRITRGVWADCTQAVAREQGITAPILLTSSHPSLLVTWGCRQPKVLVPESARAWDECRIRLVVQHELAHIRRCDWIVQLAAELLRCVYWFNPLVWMACRRLRQESEQACDDAVIRGGVVGTDYATHLVDIARSLVPQRQWAGAPGIARASSLEKRVNAMLNVTTNRRPLSSAPRIVVLVAALAVTVPLAGAVAGQAMFSSYAGSVVDASQSALPGVKVLLTHATSGATYGVTTDRFGRFEVAGVVPGDYEVQASLPGFSIFRTAVTMTGRDVHQDLTLQVGTLEEIVTVTGGQIEPPDPQAEQARAERMRKELAEGADRLARARSACSPNGSSDDRIGGQILAPRKLVDRRPVYPSTQTTGAVVILRARIGTNGRIEDVEVLRTRHPDFVAAATDAVWQWEFSPTYLNCVPVPITMTVTVQFVYQT
jgi:beta-lactamase regulating signal transducer with metallopeptidase domain